MTSDFPSASAQLAELRAGTLSAVDLMETTLRRIEAVNEQVNAIVALRPADELMADARAADQADRKGALHGLPMAIKDLADAEGLPTTRGSPIFAHEIAAKDEVMVARLRAAGAIIIGKSNVPEFGLGSHTFNPVYGATKNPYEPTRTCGGSSGGAAVALATGMLALADGSDMMGSLRNPAAWNNVYGFRPSWGRVPSEAIGDTFLHQLATLGPMARSPEDVALLLDVMSGPDPRQPHGYAVTPCLPLEENALAGKRIAWLGDWDGAFPMEPGILELCEGALRVFEALGARVDSFAAPFSAEAIWDSWTDLRSWQVAGGLEPLLAQKDALKDSAVWELERGLAMSAMQVHKASVIRSDWFQAAARVFDTYDALILPTAQVFPFPVEWDWPQEINGVQMDTYHRWMQVVVPASLLGLPSLSVPVGFGSGGLPMGMQIIGRRGADRDILSMGAAYHGETNWPARRPPVI